MSLTIDVDCIHAILAFAEDIQPGRPVGVYETRIPDSLNEYTIDVLREHAQLCDECGWLSKYQRHVRGFRLCGITQEGHNILTASKDKSKWDSFKIAAQGFLTTASNALTTLAIERLTGC